MLSMCLPPCQWKRTPKLKYTVTTHIYQPMIGPHCRCRRHHHRAPTQVNSKIELDNLIHASNRKRFTKTIPYQRQFKTFHSVYLRLFSLFPHWCSCYSRCCCLLLVIVVVIRFLFILYLIWLCSNNLFIDVDCALPVHDYR